MLSSGSSPFVVLLASVLKPIDDTRMRGKFAQTLLERPYTQVHVAGRGPARNPNTAADAARMHQHGIFEGSRLSLARLASQWRYWRLLHQLAPALVVVHAPELLPLTLLWQALGPARRFVYDVRENYALNVNTQRLYRGPLRRGLAAVLRVVEGLAARRASALILAEASYAAELPYLRPGRASGPVVVLENKYQPMPNETLAVPRGPLRAHEPLRLLFTGTLSELNGVWEAVATADALRPVWPGGVELTLIGFCQQPELLAQLQAAARNAGWLRLVGGAQPVPHAQIIAAVQRSHVGLLPYRPHPSTARCRPTKLFEYLAHGLPVLLPPNPLWTELVAAHQAGLVLNFEQRPDGLALAAALQAGHFYPSGPAADVLWAAEGKKLWRLLDSLD